MPSVTELTARRMNGYLSLVVLFLLIGLNAYLMVALVSETQAQPIINTGTLYQ